MPSTSTPTTSTLLLLLNLATARPQPGKIDLFAGLDESGISPALLILGGHLPVPDKHTTSSTSTSSSSSTWSTFDLTPSSVAPHSLFRAPVETFETLSTFSTETRVPSASKSATSDGIPALTTTVSSSTASLVTASVTASTGLESSTATSTVTSTSTTA